MRFHNPWSPDEMQLLRELAKKDLSAAEISTYFHGRTRNSIIGMCDRAGIVLTRSVGQRTRERVAKVPKNKNGFNPRFDKNMRRLKLPAEREHAGASIPFLDRTTSQCAYIIGEPKSLMCCGRETGGAVYCPAHLLLVFSGKS
jgi:hypothetical protein